MSVMGNAMSLLSAAIHLDQEDSIVARVIGISPPPFRGIDVIPVPKALNLFLVKPILALVLALMMRSLGLVGRSLLSVKHQSKEGKCDTHHREK